MSIKIFQTIPEIRTFRQELSPNLTLGFVPTMGALHTGHISLIQAAKEKCDVVVCSIFVNPTQFNKKEDLEKYPRTLDSDIELLKTAGVDIVFAPIAEEVYSGNYFLRFDFGDLENSMEGEFRKGHFNGVATIVSKLFHFIEPHFAFFGQKDLQQVAIVKDLCKALSFNTEIVRCPIIRDPKGLALSSRNARLSREEKQKALILYQTILFTHKKIQETKDVVLSRKEGIKYFTNEMSYEPEYLEIVRPDTLEKLLDLKTTSELAICIAAPIGNVRLIDNEIFTV